MVGGSGRMVRSRSSACFTSGIALLMQHGQDSYHSRNPASISGPEVTCGSWSDWGISTGQPPSGERRNQLRLRRWSGTSRVICQLVQTYRGVT